ncbi:MAG: AzlC family ABC transporter permease [Actinomycetaceae bacterium]|nr:AzlC family ABC transporter permease [Actinomycetaceae bacterium]
MPKSPISTGSTPPKRQFAPDVTAGLRDASIVGAGYIPLGAGFGMLLSAQGIAWWWSPICALIVYSGSLQYLAVDLFLASTSLGATAAASFFVNFRHVFYGLSFPLDLVKNRLARAYCVHALTDEAYALIVSRPRQELTGRRIVITQLGCHLYWIVGCTIGALVGSSLTFSPTMLETVSFTLTALFVVLAIESLKSSKAHASLIIALACAAITLLFTKDGMLVVSLTAYALLVSTLAIYKVRKERPTRRGVDHV